MISNLQQFNQEITHGLKQIGSLPRQDGSSAPGQDSVPGSQRFEGDKSNFNHRQLHQDGDAEVNEDLDSDNHAGVEHNFFDPYRQIDGS